MRLFLVLPTSLPIPSTLVLEHAKGLLHSFAAAKEVQMIVVGDVLDPTFVEYCQSSGRVSIQTSQQVTQFIKGVTNAVVFHFGAKLNWAKGFPQYFIPLLLPKQTPSLSMLQRYVLANKFEKWMKGATKVIATNDWALEQLTLHCPSYQSKLQLLSFPIQDLPALEWQDVAATKAKLTADNNYFLVFAPAVRFVDILKEFSIFKKWQQTTMHLVFVLETPTEVRLAKEQLRGYKFKEAISIYDLQELNLSWLAATYAVLWEGVSFRHAMWMEYAIQMDIPLLLDTQLALPTHWQKAGELFDFTEKMALSNHFKLYYKDEVYRQNSARTGKEWFMNTHLSDSHLDLFNKIVLSFNN
jgi:hypothetical protein